MSSSGIQMHCNSLSITAMPREENRCEAAMGDTRTGRHGKNSRTLDTGAHSAMPAPPEVIMSSSGWLRVQTNNQTKPDQGWPFQNRLAHRPSSPITHANSTVWVKPRWPQYEP